MLECQVSKLNYAVGQIVVALHILDPYLINVTFYQVNKGHYEELSPHMISPQTRKIWLQMVNNNDVTPLAPTEMNAFTNAIKTHCLMVQQHLQQDTDFTNLFTLKDVFSLAGCTAVFVQEKSTQNYLIYQLEQYKQEASLQQFTPFMSDVIASALIPKLPESKQAHILQINDECVLGILKKVNSPVYVVSLQLEKGDMDELEGLAEIPKKVKNTASVLFTKQQNIFRPAPIESVTEEQMEQIKAVGQKIIEELLNL